MKLQKWRTQGRELTRYKARRRDNFTCQECHKVWKEGQRHFDVHHLNGLCGKMSKKYDKIKDIGGLITLCHKCHFNRHDWAGLDKLQKSRYSKRNTSIKKQHSKGKSLSELGRKYKVTRQRIFQIVNT